jgi:hypothetical protein
MFYLPVEVLEVDWDIGIAIGENKAVLAALIGSFDFKPVGGKMQDIEIIYVITARIVGGLPVGVTAVNGW